MQEPPQELEAFILSGSVDFIRFRITLRAARTVDSRHDNPFNVEWPPLQDGKIRNYGMDENAEISTICGCRMQLREIIRNRE